MVFHYRGIVRHLLTKFLQRFKIPFIVQSCGHANLELRGFIIVSDIEVMDPPKPLTLTIAN